jgi:NAD(P)H-hydrate epimerase
MKLVTAAQMQSLDRRAIHEAGIAGAVLMERAGAGVVAALAGRYGSPKGKSVTVLCGKGNNGGDGFVIARLLRRGGARVRVVLTTEEKGLTSDARTMYRRFVRLAGRAVVSTCRTGTGIEDALRGADFIVDALFGTGLTHAVTGLHQEVIDAINACAGTRRIPVIAVDLPSGLHADSGAILGTAVRADLTVTFGLPKVGLYTGAGIDRTGSVTVADIGIPPAYVESLDTPLSVIEVREIAALLPARRPSGHKGQFGHAGIVAGSPGKTGAAAMAARAALRAGAGLVTVATPTGVSGALDAKLLEAMSVAMPETDAHTLGLEALEPLVSFANSRTAVALGPGLSTHSDTVTLVHRLLPRLDVPVIIDADGLNAIAVKLDVIPRTKREPVLTPHPGEMARLTGESAQAINNDRIGTAARFAARHHAVVVLKGARTVVAHPDGRAAVCPTGNPGMATAGTGDVLTGVIAAFLSQSLAPWDAARAAVYLHGLAGDRAAARVGPVGMIAGDVIDELPHAIREITAKA